MALHRLQEDHAKSPSDTSSSVVDYNIMTVAVIHDGTCIQRMRYATSVVWKQEPQQ